MSSAMRSTGAGSGQGMRWLCQLSKLTTQIATLPPNTTSYTDVLTTADVNFEYRVRAYDAEGGMTYSPYTNTAVSTVDCE